MDLSTTNGSLTTENGKRAKMVTELEQFDEIFPELVQTLLSADMKNPEISEASKWFKEVLEYNVPHGKKNRGQFVIMAYRYLVEKPAEGDLHLARILGWCIELLQAFFLVADDIMDQSLTRRGQPCWYKKDGVGFEAINDCVFLDTCIFKVLKKYIRDQPYYIHVFELFQEITHNTCTGQCLDMIVSPPPGVTDFTNYTMDKYKAIVKWKTGFYSFYMPVALAMYMAGITDEEKHSCAKTILLKMGEYFQIQDDYLDCYGNPEVIGKIGTDIQDNKCSWLVVTALQQATPEQLLILKENYGSWDEEKVKRVKDLYKRLNLEKSFKDYEDSSFQEISSLIDTCSGNLPKEMFRTIMNKIYKRNK